MAHFAEGHEPEQEYHPTNRHITSTHDATDAHGAMMVSGRGRGWGTQRLYPQHVNGKSLNEGLK